MRCHSTAILHQEVQICRLLFKQRSTALEEELWAIHQTDLQTLIILLVLRTLSETSLEMDAYSSQAHSEMLVLAASSKEGGS